MLSVRKLSVTHQKDLRELVHDLSFTVSRGDRLALIGEEGNGKSTILKLIAAPEEALAYCTYTGDICFAGEKLGYLPQEVPQSKRDMSACDFCLESEAFQNLSPREMNALCAKVRLDPAVCYADCPVRSLSGGEKIKLQLMLMLAENPTILLLDEPSNDLDLPALAFLEHFIGTCELPVVFISHDETLLSRTATRILHIEQVYRKQESRWTLANVPYNTYMTERAQRMVYQEQQAQMEKRQERIQQEKFERIQQTVEAAQNNISRQDPHGGRLLKKKMKAVKSLEKRYERERENQTQRPNIEYAMDASFMGEHALPTGKRVLDLSLDCLQTGDRVLAKNVALRMIGPEKVLIIGDNGCGKTTLLRLLQRELSNRSDIRAAYMPQRYEELLDESKTPVAFLHTKGDKEQLTQIRTSLGALRFTTEEMTSPIRDLSGGQKAKVLWLTLLISDANVLLLDEPTRNLSPLSAPVVRELMTEYIGAVIAVTHDRTLISSWPGRVLRLTPNGLSLLSNAEIEAL